MGKWWIGVFALLSVAIVAGSAMLGFQRIANTGQVEIVISSPEASPDVEVYLNGAVDEAGIYTFTEDSSISDVLRTAGASSDSSEVIKLRVVVLSDDESSADSPQAAVPSKSKININTASIELLDTLPGIGPSFAQRIIDYRNEHGSFRSIDELTNVKGIGPKTLEKMRDEITVID